MILLWLYCWLCCREAQPTVRCHKIMTYLRGLSYPTYFSFNNFIVCLISGNLPRPHRPSQSPMPNDHMNAPPRPFSLMYSTLAWKLFSLSKVSQWVLLYAKGTFASSSHSMFHPGRAMSSQNYSKKGFKNWTLIIKIQTYVSIEYIISTGDVCIWAVTSWIFQF